MGSESRGGDRADPLQLIPAHEELAATTAAQVRVRQCCRSPLDGVSPTRCDKFHISSSEQSYFGEQLLQEERWDFVSSSPVTVPE